MAITDRGSLIESKTFIEKYRSLQILKHGQILGSRKGDPSSLGHRLSPQDAEKGLNFISPEAHLYAVKRSKSWRVFVNRERVLGNLISSQALCFNLFTDLKMGLLKKDPEAGQAVKNMFPTLPIEKVISLDLEKLPRIEGFKKVATCFDAVLVFKDVQGGESLLGLEVKYLEGLDEKRVGGGAKWQALAKRFGIFNAAGLKAYPPKLGFNQIARNFLLTLAYARYPQKKAYSFTLGLTEDEETRKKVRQFQKLLQKPFRELVQFIALEDLIQGGLSEKSGSYGDLFEKWKTRYLG